jgi:hypothetical protein
MADLMTDARARLKLVLDAEFTADGFSVSDDKLNRAIGRDGAQIGISPIRERPGSNAGTLEAEILVQVYGWYDPQINEFQQVDPAVVEDWAERFKDAMRPESIGNTSVFWYVRIEEILFPDDPTGNKSRFEARVKAFGNNNAIFASV